MFLKSLTLRGFKSFADRTTVVLEPGISIIVGPNGSGKSNIIDAVSWVLGEQGPRSLRGGRMEDVIFAGTPQRPALAMAEVSLTIDNTAGDLPLEFSEVTVTRTLFRSGEAEYRLNGLPCRLLDIREVLSDGGIGREQHTIIGQGHLDDMLIADPTQIRAYVEEAAGVAKHRRRKERALRRIAATEANLVRIADVLAEVRRLLRPLREQAEMARRHAAVAEELGRIQLVLAARELAEIRRRLGPDGALDLDAPIRSSEHEIADLDQALVAAGRERAEAAGRRERGREVAWSLNRLAERLRALARLAHERERAGERRQTLDAARGRARAVLAEARATLAALEAAEEPHVETLAELEDRLEAAERDRQSALRSLAEAERQAATWRARAQVRAGASPEATRRLASSGLEGVIGVLSDLVEIPPESKAALEALVGPASSVLVVADAEAAQRALEAAGAGEPLGILVAAALPPPALGGRPLVELVRPLGPPAAAALGGVYVAAGPAEAARLAGEHPQGVFVTLEGVMATGRLLVSTSAAAGARAAEAEAALAAARHPIAGLEAAIAGVRGGYEEAA